MNDSFINAINDYKTRFKEIEDQLKNYRSRIEPSKRRLFSKEIKSELHSLYLDIFMDKSIEIRDFNFKYRNPRWNELSAEKSLKVIENLLNDCKERINDITEPETNDQEMPRLFNKMFFKATPELFKFYINQLLIHNIIKCDIEKALSFDEYITFIGEYPEKDVAAFMSYLNEEKNIIIDANKTICLCFRKESGEWNKKRISKYRNKFKYGEIKNHIEKILKK